MGASFRTDHEGLARQGSRALEDGGRDHRVRGAREAAGEIQGCVQLLRLEERKAGALSSQDSSVC